MWKPRPIPAWQAPFLEALALTRNVRVAAGRAGIDGSAVYNRRLRDAGFAAAWSEVLDQGLPADGETGEDVSRDPSTIRSSANGPPSRPAAGEELVLRHSAAQGTQMVQAVAGRWSRGREERFVAAMAETANVRRAAAVAGVSTTAVYARRLRYPGFARAWEAAIEIGRSRLESYLIEAAGRSFDPAAFPDIDGLPRVTVGEAIGILRLKGGRASSKRGGPEHDAEPDANEVSEATERIMARLGRLRERDRQEKLEAGWQEWQGEMIPPGLQLPPSENE